MATARGQTGTAGRFLSGGGGLVSTTSDYLRFCLMLLHDGEFAGQQLLERTARHIEVGPVPLYRRTP